MANRPVPPYLRLVLRPLLEGSNMMRCFSNGCDARYPTFEGHKDAAFQESDVLRF